MAVGHRTATRRALPRGAAVLQQPPSWTPPQHAPRGPDARGHRGISRAHQAVCRAPGAGAMGSPSTTTSHNHSLICYKDGRFFSTRVTTCPGSQRNRNNTIERFSGKCRGNHENPACYRYRYTTTARSPRLPAPLSVGFGTSKNGKNPITDDVHCVGEGAREGARNCSKNRARTAWLVTERHINKLRTKFGRNRP